MNSNGCDHFNDMLPICRIPIIYFLTRILRGSQMTINSLFVWCTIVIVQTWTSWNDNLESPPFTTDMMIDLSPKNPGISSKERVTCKTRIRFSGSLEASNLFFFCWWLKSRTSCYPMLYRACLIHPRWLAGFLWISSPTIGSSLDSWDVDRYHQKVSNLRSDDVVDALCDENSGEAASEAGSFRWRRFHSWQRRVFTRPYKDSSGASRGHVCWREDPLFMPYLEVKFKSPPCYNVPYLGSDCFWMCSNIIHVEDM